MVFGALLFLKHFLFYFCFVFCFVPKFLTWFGSFFWFEFSVLLIYFLKGVWVWWFSIEVLSYFGLVLVLENIFLFDQFCSSNSF